MAYVKGQPFIPQFSDPASGSLMSNGTIEFYLSGTSTPTPYYTDAVGTEGGTSLTLDSGGRPPTDIYYETGINYKIIVKNESQDVIDTIDPYYVLSIASTYTFDSVSDMVSSTDITVGMQVETRGYNSIGDGGDNVYRIVAAGTGVADGGHYIDLATHQAEGLFPNGDVTVNQFGAISNRGTGSTDNATFIANAAAYVKFRTGGEGGVLKFEPRGTGYLTSQVAIASWQGLTIDLNSMPVQMIDSGINNYIFELTNCVESNIINGRLIGTSDTVSTYNDTNRQAGIGVIGGSGCSIDNVDFEKFISFGVHAEAMTPATTIRGLDVTGCTFKDFPLDPATNEQCGVHLVNGAEYCNTNYNHFQGVPCAQRDVGGANSNFNGNMVMKSNGQFNDNSAAALYSEYDDNFGKYNVSFNHINHNDSGNRLLVMKGNPLNTRNPSYISHNQFLSNGNETSSNAILLHECNKVQLNNNNIRENINITSPSNGELIKIVDSNKIKIKDNLIQGADYAITNDNSNILLGENDFEDQDTDLIQVLNGGTHKLLKNRTYNVHVAANHTIEHTDDPGVTIAGTTVGTYAFSHSFGTENFNVCCEAQETGDDVVFKVVKRSAVIDVFVTRRDTGAAIDREFNMTIVHNLDSSYPVGIN